LSVSVEEIHYAPHQFTRHTRSHLGTHGSRHPAHRRAHATVVKRLLQDALAAEGELQLTPRPKPNRVFERITTIADDAC
jgi:hypothetical protein